MEKTELRDNIKIKDSSIHASAFVAEGARVIGDVILHKDSSIWYNTVARGDINQIVVGARSNVQDNSVIHLENDQGVVIGDDVTIGHNAIIHGCKIEDGALIGMGAIIMNGAVIGSGAIIGAGAVVKENMIVKPCELVVGVPGKVVKILPNTVLNQNIDWAGKYVKLARIHKAHQKSKN
jgi:carbonic anhydrase/acetyltransferase-like protein (isoleucine patch superfamily)|tara:strand:+ start:3289 stop:3825 length:537 start_codon:yes stop_codon:yes gene_type:complete